MVHGDWLTGERKRWAGPIAPAMRLTRGAQKNSLDIAVEAEVLPNLIGRT
jgi:hypothetical protein